MNELLKLNPQKKLRILHTSDWHIGLTLCGRKRYEEIEAFLFKLAEIIQTEKIDILLIAGDVFDNSTPSNRAQEIYYRFLHRVAESSCRHIVVIAGNHDSPSFLNAPKELLRFLNIHVVGSITESPEDEVLLLKDKSGVEELVVCAVPYLRDRDIRTAQAGESVEDKERKLFDGICSHYQEVFRLAQQKRLALSHPVPIVVMGHLFTAGSQTLEGDGVRGFLAQVPAENLPEGIDYFALGHLHSAQKISGNETMRYSGSPLQMDFCETRQMKSIYLIEFSGLTPDIRLIELPVFQKLESIRGSFSDISSRLQQLTDSDSMIWLDIVYDGDEIIGNLKERLKELAGNNLEILRTRIRKQILNPLQGEEQLEELDINEVFARCLAANEVPQAQHPELFRAYREIITSLHEEDVKAE